MFRRNFATVPLLIILFHWYFYNFDISVWNIIDTEGVFYNSRGWMWFVPIIWWFQNLFYKRSWSLQFEMKHSFISQNFPCELTEATSKYPWTNEANVWYVLAKFYSKYRVMMYVCTLKQWCDRFTCPLVRFQIR